MRFEKNIQERYATITLLEEKLTSLLAPSMKEELVLLNASGAKNIILNLENVKYIDSSGLSVLLRGHQICDNADGYFVICNPNDHVTKLIKISQLQDKLNLAPTEQEAVEAIFMAELEDELKAKEGQDTKSINN